MHPADGLYLEMRKITADCRFTLLSITYGLTMRRLIAALVILLLTGVPVLSAFAATPVSSDLPACCKKGGAHMCSVRRSQTHPRDGKPALYAVCPFAGKINPVIPGQRVALSLTTACSAAPAPKVDTIGASQVLVLVSSLHFENFKRGPPPALS